MHVTSYFKINYELFLASFCRSYSLVSVSVLSHIFFKLVMPSLQSAMIKDLCPPVLTKIRRESLGVGGGVRVVGSRYTCPSFPYAEFYTLV